MKLLINVLAAFIFNKKKRHEFRKKAFFYKRCCSLNFKKRFFDTGKRNKVIINVDGFQFILSKFWAIKGLELYINGCDNIIKLNFPIIANNSLIKLDYSNNSSLLLGPTRRMINTMINFAYGDNQKCTIGTGTTFRDSHIEINETNCQCIIGEDCKFAKTSIWCADGHSIIDDKTKKVINRSPKKITIGNHCWLCENSRINKGGSIADNTIVGSMSLVTKNITTPNVILGGIPAKIIKTGINWDRRNPEHYIWETEKK